MKIPFFKYQGAGNDFVMIDNRVQSYLDRTNQAEIERLCDRRFGIGADGLILLENKEGYDFEMVYFNADGRESTMCGNGGRCIVAFAKMLGIIKQDCVFLAIDGPHEAKIEGSNWVELKMKDVEQVEIGAGFYYLDTGSPHYVKFVEDLDEIDVFEQGRAIRYSERFKAEGTNVNFAQETPNGLAVATYERGVEAETLACGTGVTACALAFSLAKADFNQEIVPIQAKGGQLEVRFERAASGFKSIWLNGPAELVFSGTIDLI